VKFGHLSKQDRFEVSVKEFHPNVHDASHQLWAHHRPPETEYQAMMEAMPHEPVPMTAVERELDWKLFWQKVRAANLTARERIVVDCIIYGGMSLFQTAIVVAQAEGRNKALSKMTVMRCRDKAYSKIRAVFEQEDN
jgi:DNA-binding CsgD family transcriptional regulator